MNTYKKPTSIEIVYFTGTGGTRRVADQLVAGFTEQGIAIKRHEINSKKSYVHNKVDMMLVLYPVYAFNAPRPVYEFINKLPAVPRTPTVVISVSAGGEVILNAACRLHCIRRLEKKGFHVVYENMIVMPSNFLTETPETLSVRLLHILPKKVDYIINDLLCGVGRRTFPNPISRFFSFVGEIEKSSIGDQLIGRLIKATDPCTGCGLCKRTCPTGNIRIRNGKPVFAGKCSLCMGCIYKCPKKALKLRIIGFIVLKEGFNLNSIEKKMSRTDIMDKKDLVKGWGYGGILKYLSEEH